MGRAVKMSLMWQLTVGIPWTEPSRDRLVYRELFSATTAISVTFIVKSGFKKYFKSAGDLDKSLNLKVPVDCPKN